MRTRFTFPLVPAAAVLLLFVAGCSKEPETELDKLVDQVVDESIRGWGQVNYKIVPKLNEYGEEAIAALLKAAEEEPEHLQPCYSTILTLINAEPARFEACKKLLENHPNIDVRKDAVEGFARDGAPEEAVKECMRLVSEAEEGAIRCVAIYALRERKAKTYRREIYRTIRKATADPDQDVREHAQRALDIMDSR